MTYYRNDAMIISSEEETILTISLAIDAPWGKPQLS